MPSDFFAEAAPALAPGGTARLYFDLGTNQMRLSQNGLAYVDLAALSGWSYASPVISLATATDTVALGASAMAGTEKIRVVVDDAVDALNTYVAVFDHTTTVGTFGAAGIGAGIKLRVEDNTGGVADCGSITATATDTAPGSFTSQLNFFTRQSGVGLTTYMQLLGTGLLRLTLSGANSGLQLGTDFRMYQIALGTARIEQASGGTAGAMEFGKGSTATVSNASTGRVRYNEALQRFQASMNGSSYIDLGSAVYGGGWVEAAAVVSLITDTNQVSVGSAAPAASTQFSSLAATAGWVAGRFRTNVANDDTSQEVLRLERSDGSSTYARFDARGHAAFGPGLQTSSSALVIAENSVSAGFKYRAFRGRLFRGGATTIANGTSVRGCDLEAQATNGGSSDGTLTIGDGSPSGLYLGGFTKALHLSTSAHTGDFAGFFAFAGGDAAVALGPVQRAQGLAGQVGFTTNASSTGALQNGYAVRGLSPAGLAAGRTIGDAVGFRAENQGATGVTNAIGIDVAAQSGASGSNIGIRTASVINITGGGIDHDAGNIGFFGNAQQAQQVSGADLTNNVTSGGTDNVIDNWTDLTTYSTDAAAIRNAVYQLARKLKQVNDALRLYGLLT